MTPSLRGSHGRLERLRESPWLAARLTAGAHKVELSPTLSSCSVRDSSSFREDHSLPPRPAGGAQGGERELRSGEGFKS